jgi:hypothetical protein
MTPSGSASQTNLSTLETPEPSTTPAMNKTLAEPSPSTLTLEQWSQNGLNRFNDQETPFPKVF